MRRQLGWWLMILFYVHARFVCHPGFLVAHTFNFKLSTLANCFLLILQPLSVELGPGILGNIFDGIQVCSISTLQLLFPIFFFYENNKSFLCYFNGLLVKRKFTILEKLDSVEKFLMLTAALLFFIFVDARGLWKLSQKDLVMCISHVECLSQLLTRIYFGSLNLKKLVI